MAGYSRFRGNLKLRLALTSTAHDYGAILASYSPMTAVRDAGLLACNAFAGGRGPLIDTNLNQTMLSQRQSVMLYPQDSTTVDMVLPFVWHQDYLNFIGETAGSYFAALGVLDIISVCPVTTVGTNSTPITLTIFASMENIVLDGPCYVLQDEYQEAPVSTAATALSNFASGAVAYAPPFLRPYAVATSVASGMVASLAKALGYTAPSVVHNTVPMVSRAMANCANTFISDPYECLSIDPKHGISCSDKDVGGSGEDELDLNNFCSRSAIWFTTNVGAGSTGIFTSFQVSPQVFTSVSKAFATAGNYEVAAFAPVGYAASMFRLWRATMVYDIEFICTKYHSGKIEIIYDPNGSSSVDTTLQRTHIVDIAVTRSCRVVVPYAAGTPMLTNAMASDSAYTMGFSTSGAPSTIPRSYNAAFHNGTISMRVVNNISAPKDGATIMVIVKAHAKDVVFAEPRLIDCQTLIPEANPRLMFSHSDPYNLQSLEMDEVVFGKTTVFNPTTCVGEVILSARALLGRMLFYDERRYSAASTNSGIIRIFRYLARFPYGPGLISPLTPSALYPVNIGATNMPYNFGRFNYMTWLTPCFVGWRGSIKWRFRYGCTVDPSSLSASVCRADDTFYLPTSTVIQQESALIQTNALTQAKAMQYAALGCPDDALGSSRSVGSEGVVSIRAPHYSMYSMYPANPASIPASGYMSAPYACDLVNDNLRLDVFGATTVTSAQTYYVSSYVGAGEDFSPLVFINCPLVYRYGTTVGGSAATNTNSITAVTT